MKITFAFYHHLMQIENIRKISNNVDIRDGYIYFQNNIEMKVKIVDFHNMNLENVLERISLIDGIQSGNPKYTVDTIKAYDNSNVLHMAYIIY